MRSRKIALVCGIVSSLLYLFTDMLGGMLWEGYSFISQPISALAAVGAPVQTLTTPLFFIYAVLLLVFGVGVFKSAGRKRALRVTGGLLIAIGIIGLAWTPFPMHLDESVSSPANTVHSLFAGVQVILTLLAMGFGAAAFRGWFRFYSIATILVLLLAGSAAFWLAAAGQPGSWFGVIERITVYGYLLWMAILAIVLVRAEKIQQ